MFRSRIGGMKPHSKNLYLHVDGDSFFVACELTLQPELRGRPVIVGGDRGIAVAMSGEAKKLGVTRGMPVFQIKKFYPEVVILPHNFDLYRDISKRLQQILSSYFQEVEVYSIDECFALVQPEEIKYYGGEGKLMCELKTEIEKTLGVTYSLGLARTKSLAKQASKLEKPNGLVMLLNKEDEVRALKATPIDDIWGIGSRTIPMMKRMGFKAAYDFVNFSAEKVIGRFSRPMQVLKRDLGGEELMEVHSNTDPRDQKSIQSTNTFRPASMDAKIIWREIAENAEHACGNARELHLVTKKVSFFVKTSEFKYYIDEIKLSQYTADPGVVLNALEPRLSVLLKTKERIRSTGVTLHNLVREEDVPRDLFGIQEKAINKLIIEEVADKIRKKHGASMIKRVASMKRK